ncbi:hypothetical protein CC80DRAFT_393714, partial [Byssothecium circinans]
RLRVVDRWLALCQRYHKRCIRHSIPRSEFLVPSRLIDLRQPSRPRLILNHALTKLSNIQYATASHRWRDEMMPKLLLVNIDDMRRAITGEFHTLGLQRCHRDYEKTSIRYFWIDALCIVHDDPCDVDQE